MFSLTPVLSIFTHSLKHSIAHFIVDYCLGIFLAKNNNVDVAIESFFFSFVGLCFNLEDFIVAKVILSILFLFVSIYFELEYKPIINRRKSSFYNFCHELIHYTVGFLLELYFSYSHYSYYGIPYSMAVAVFFYAAHLLWEVKGYEACRFLFALALFIHVGVYCCLNIVIFAGVRKMIIKLY